MCYMVGGKVKEGSIRREPIKRTDGKVVVVAVVKYKLSFEIGERIEFFNGVKVFIVLAVRTLNLAVMAWSEGTDQLVAYPTLIEVNLKQCGAA